MFGPTLKQINLLLGYFGNFGNNFLESNDILEFDNVFNICLTLGMIAPSQVSVCFCIIMLNAKMLLFLEFSFSLLLFLVQVFGY